MAKTISAERLLHNQASSRVVSAIRSGPEMSADDFAGECRRLVGRALGALVSIMENEEATASARAAAAVTIIERAHGKAAQQINTTHTDMTALHLAALREVANAAQHNVVDVTPLPANPFEATDIVDDPT